MNVYINPPSPADLDMGPYASWSDKFCADEDECVYEAPKYVVPPSVVVAAEPVGPAPPTTCPPLVRQPEYIIDAQGFTCEVGRDL